MDKKYISYDDEFDISNLIKKIWYKKVMIVILSCITFATIFFFTQYIEKTEVKTYKHSLTINPTKAKEFSKILYLINAFYKKGNFNIEEFFLDSFMEELMDYNELVSVLQNNKKIKQKISKLPQENQSQALFKYASKLKIKKVENSKKYLLTFKWDDKYEAYEIIDQTLKLVKLNLKDSFYEVIEGKIAEKRKNAFNRDLERIDYLTEQKAIAKELSIEENQIDNVNLTQSSISFNVNTNDVAYYLRGYKAIDKEIKLIQERKYTYINDLVKQVEEAKKLNLNWVDYNIYLIKTKQLNKPPLTVTLMLVTSLIIALSVAFISSVIELNKSAKEN